MRILTVATLLVLFSFIAADPSSAQDLSGKVISVSDGDTIEILLDSTPVKIRLNGIDCPELYQVFDGKAKQFTSDACLGGTVTVATHGKNRYGRVIGGGRVSRILQPVQYRWLSAAGIRSDG